jgi:hypothetical protein
VAFITFHILAPGEVVVRAGEPSTFLGLLVWGEVCAQRGTLAGSQHGALQAWYPRRRPAWCPHRLPALCPPSVVPSQAPSVVPSQAPSVVPSLAPSVVLSQAPSVSPSMAPSASPAQAPSASPSQVDILDHKGAVQDVADQGALIGEAAFFFGGKRLTSAHPAHLSPRVMCRVTPLAQGLVGGLCSRCSGERESAPPVCAYIHT